MPPWQKLMSKTVADILTEARGYLQDTSAEPRYSQEDLISFLNDAVFEIRRLRPDLFLGTYGQPVIQYDDTELLELFAFPQYATATGYFVAGSAELRDDEFVDDNRAMTLLARFSSMLLKAS